MKIWVDADACPVVIKEILYKAAKRTGVQLILVANRVLRTPSERNITSILVSAGMDVADTEIINRSAVGDLVITADIPLAAEVVAKGSIALNPRGRLYTEENIRESLNTRDFLDELRSSGVETGGPSALSKRDKQQFANHLDQVLSRAIR